MIKVPNGRRPFDFYPTADPLTCALLDRVPIAGRVLEPCAGAGDMVSVLEASPAVAHVATNDIDPNRPGWDLHGDATDPAALCWATSYDWVVTNPPFSDAAAILAHAWDHARIGVAFLLRLSFLEPANGRGGWLAAHAGEMSHLLIINPRPSFTGDGKTDSVTAAWMVWRRGHVGGCNVGFITEWR